MARKMHRKSASSCSGSSGNADKRSLSSIYADAFKIILLLTALMFPAAVIAGDDAKDINIHIYPELNIGIAHADNLSSWEKDRSHSYLNYIQGADPEYADYTMRTTRTSGKFYGNRGVGLAADIFYHNFGIGIGVSGNLVRTVSNTTYSLRQIHDESGQNRIDIDYQLFSRDISSSLFYRQPLCKIDDAELFIRYGLGISYYTLYYSYDISGSPNSAAAAPYQNQFRKNFSGSSFGYNLSCALTGQISSYSGFVGFSLTRVTIHSFKDDSSHETVRFSNNGRLRTNINVFNLNFGIGLNL